MKIIHANLLTDGHCYENYDVHVRASKILSVQPSLPPSVSSEYTNEQIVTFENLKSFVTTTTLDQGFSNVNIENLVIDLKNQYYLCPGFIDIHNHGAMMADTMDGTATALDTIARFHAAHGVTTFLPTTMTAPLHAYVKVFDTFAGFTPSVPVTMPGIHMEGPFLSKAAAGAQPAANLLEPSEKHFAFLDQYHKLIKLMTISPDVPGITKLMDFCFDRGITLSGGHDSAIDTEIYETIEHHLASVTHIYCCSSSISRRTSPQKHLGLTQIGLLSPHLFCETIADNCHIPPVLFDFILKCKGYKKICLVSDAIRATGMPPGQYYLGSETDGTLVNVTNEVALLPDQNLYAGSITPISKMVYSLAKKHTIPLAQITYMASGAPADLLHLDSKGRIQTGFDAEFNILDDNGALLATLIHENYIHFS